MRGGCSLVILAGGLSRRMGRDKAALLCGLAGEVDAVVPRLDSEPQGVCAVYDRGLAPRIERLLAAGERRLKMLLAASKVRYVTPDELRPVDPELRSFRNINTPAEYRAWLLTQPASP